jgi:predicted TIM-barrel fold metal-dependent hydrolase
MPQDKIDVHAHYIPEVYRNALVAAGQDRPDGIPALPAWNEELALAAMDELDVRMAILSISSLGLHFGEAAAAVELARTVNEVGAHIVRAKSSRFGFFAALPLPEIDAAVTETRYALDKLGANGICLFTNHGGMYLGDERLEPIYAEVAARKSVVFVHPTSAPQPTEGLDFAAPMLEFIFETTCARSPISCSRECSSGTPNCGSSFRMPARRCRSSRAASTCSPGYWRTFPREPRS